MEPLNFSRSNVLNVIPNKKVIEAIKEVENGPDSLQDKHTKIIAINRYAESNIPILYWNLKMEKDFVGDPRLLDKYKEYTLDLKQSYLNGISICFAGSNGLGKSLTTCCILKKASLKGYSSLYTTVADIVTALTQAPNEEKFLAKKELCLVDFLLIDELDPKFFSTDNAADLYARSLEIVFRSRAQNKLPTLMCTNSPNLVEAFNGSLKASIDSLMKGYVKMFPVFGEDFRKKEK